IEARLAGATEALAEEWLVVEAGGDELADPRADPALLRELAEATGGTFYPSPDDAPSLADLDTTRTRSLGIVSEEPLSGGWAFLLLVAFFAGEWFLRRRWGRR